jgi:hypothetical protein
MALAHPTLFVGMPLKTLEKYFIKLGGRIRQSGDIIWEYPGLPAVRIGLKKEASPRLINLVRRIEAGRVAPPRSPAAVEPDRARAAPTQKPKMKIPPRLPQGDLSVAPLSPEALAAIQAEALRLAVLKAQQQGQAQPRRPIRVQPTDVLEAFELIKDIQGQHDIHTRLRPQIPQAELPVFDAYLEALQDRLIFVPPTEEESTLVSFREMCRNLGMDDDALTRVLTHERQPGEAVRIAITRPRNPALQGFAFRLLHLPVPASALIIVFKVRPALYAKCRQFIIEEIREMFQAKEDALPEEQV